MGLKYFQSCYDVDISNCDQKNPLIVFQSLLNFFLHFTLLQNGRSVHFMRVVFTLFMTVLKSLLVRFSFSKR